MVATAARAAAAAEAARIGPNAVTRVAEALERREGARAAFAVFEAAGLLPRLAEPPRAMVDEAEVRRLHAAVHGRFGRERAQALLREAGGATAEYLLAHRIPRPLQALLRRLPPRLAARVLLAAVSRHAWTFVGSGRFAARALPGAGAPAWELEIRDNPLVRGIAADEPICGFYAGTFERLFRALVSDACRVRETACEARGDDACRLLVSGG